MKYFLISFFTIFLFSCNDSNTGDFISTDIDNEETTKIKNQIENVYFGLSNGAYTKDGLSGTSPESLPFYNTDLSTLMIMGLTPLAMLNGTFSIEPQNIKVTNLTERTADVNYLLVVSKKVVKKEIQYL